MKSIDAIDVISESYVVSTFRPKPARLFSGLSERLYLRGGNMKGYFPMTIVALCFGYAIEASASNLTECRVFHALATCESVAECRWDEPHEYCLHRPDCPLVTSKIYCEEDRRCGWEGDDLSGKCNWKSEENAEEDFPSYTGKPSSTDLKPAPPVRRTVTGLANDVKDSAADVAKLCSGKIGVQDPTKISFEDLYPVAERTAEEDCQSPAVRVGDWVRWANCNPLVGFHRRVWAKFQCE
jgi:hypothetical protein